MGKPESRTEVKSFAELALDLCGEDNFFQTRMRNVSPIVGQKLTEARKHILNNGYHLQLHYVTTGRVSKNIRDESHAIVRRYGDVASIDIFDGRQVLLMLSDYLDGVAPPVPSIDLPMEAGGGIETSGALRRMDRKTGIESWVFSMSADAVSCIFEHSGTRLFARNVRGFLGATEINESMQATLDKQPGYFWYYNNGLTIICDHVERIISSGRDVLRVTNPQVINGQQTTRVLYANGKRAHGASVLVRVMRVPRELEDRSDGFETLVSNIVQATNWQNAIRPSDLMSNDRRQIEIERNMRKLDYLYVRKRQTKGEARRSSAASYRFIVKKEEVAQAIAACDLDPAVLREGKERLFEERWYSHIFPNAAPAYYLSRYWLMCRVSYAAYGYPERAYAKWVVMSFIWQYLRPLVQSRINAEVFRRENEFYNSPTHKALGKAVHIAFRAILRFYRHKRGKGAKAIDVSTFFQRKKLDSEFLRYWKSSANQLRLPFRRAWQRFERKFKEAIEE